MFRTLTTLTSTLPFSRVKMRPISTAACLIIGDEILNGKVHDTNSNYFAKYCFKLGVDLRHIAVVPDEQDEIQHKVTELAGKYDFIVTSGGIGPTHDDITYEAIAHAFGLKVAVHPDTKERMGRLSKFKPDSESALQAQLRMATLPTGPAVDYHFVYEDMWVPIVAIHQKVHILPGIPSIFTKLLEGLKPLLVDRVAAENQQVRFYVKTSMKESQIAPLLDQLQKQWGAKGVKIGSYPHMKLGSNTVSVIAPKSQQASIEPLVKEIEAGVRGQIIDAAEEDQRTGQE